MNITRELHTRLSRLTWRDCESGLMEPPPIVGVRFHGREAQCALTRSSVVRGVLSMFDFGRLSSCSHSAFAGRTANAWQLWRRTFSSHVRGRGSAMSTEL